MTEDAYQICLQQIERGFATRFPRRARKADEKEVLLSYGLEGTDYGCRADAYAHLVTNAHLHYALGFTRMYLEDCFIFVSIIKKK